MPEETKTHSDKKADEIKKYFETLFPNKHIIVCLDDGEDDSVTHNAQLTGEASWRVFLRKQKSRQFAESSAADC